MLFWKLYSNIKEKQIKCNIFLSFNLKYFHIEEMLAPSNPQLRVTVQSPVMTHPPPLTTQHSPVITGSLH